MSPFIADMGQLKKRPGPPGGNALADSAMAAGGTGRVGRGGGKSKKKTKRKKKSKKNKTRKKSKKNKKKSKEWTPKSGHELSSEMLKCLRKPWQGSVPKKNTKNKKYDCPMFLDRSKPFVLSGTNKAPKIQLDHYDSCYEYMYKDCEKKTQKGGKGLKIKGGILKRFENYKKLYKLTNIIYGKKSADKMSKIMYPNDKISKNKFKRKYNDSNSVYFLLNSKSAKSHHFLIKNKDIALDNNIAINVKKKKYILKKL